MKTPGVETPSCGYLEMAEKWQLIDDLYHGTSSMLAARKTYLPQRPGEADETYRERLENSTLLNAVRWAVKTLSAKPFGKPLQLSDRTSAWIRDEFQWDVTGDGRSLHAFGREVFENSLRYGLNHVLVEWPEVGLGLTSRDEIERSVRPYFVEISPKNLFAWKYARVGGVVKLVQVRFHEKGIIDSEWGEVEVDQIRVIDVDRQRIFRTDERTKEWTLFKETPVVSPFDHVPLVTTYTGRTGPMLANPPLEDLAHLNVKHWRKQSNLDYIESAQFPILFGKNLAREENDVAASLPMGVMMMIHTSMEGASLELIEPSGSSISELRTSLEKLETEMASQSAQLLAKRTGNETATARAIDSAESISSLQAMARDFERSLEVMCEYAARWKKVKNANADIELYRDFGSTLTSDDISDLLAARKEGLISNATYITETKRRGFLSEGVTAKDEAERLAAEKGTIAPHKEEKPAAPEKMPTPEEMMKV